MVYDNLLFVFFWKEKDICSFLFVQNKSLDAILAHIGNDLSDNR